jgi:hypothetical protein
MILTTNSSNLPKQHLLIGLYNEEYVLCEVEAQFLYTIQMNSSLQSVKIDLQYNVKLWTEFRQVRMRSTDGSFEYDDVPSYAIRSREFHKQLHSFELLVKTLLH